MNPMCRFLAVSISIVMIQMVRVGAQSLWVPTIDISNSVNSASAAVEILPQPGQAPGGPPPMPPSLSGSTFRLKDSGLYQLNFTYDIPDNNAFQIEGLGLVSGKGTIAGYISKSPELKLIHVTSRQEYMSKFTALALSSVAATTATTFPDESDFPPAYRSGQIKRGDAFVSHLIQVIQEHFSNSFSTIGDGAVLQYRTPYATLPSLPNMKAEVAVLISQPHLEGGTDRFRVRYILRDKPRLSTTWHYGNELNAVTVTSGEALLHLLVDALEKQ